MTNASGQTPDPLDFPMPDASDAPSKASAPYWIGWRIAEARAASLQAENTRLKDQFRADNSQLRDEIRAIDIERATLVERVRSFEDHNRLVTMISTGLIGLAGLVGGIVIYLPTSNSDNDGLTGRMAVLALLLLLVGAGVQWLPVRRRRESPEP